jgi:hypothetical protein
MVEGVVSTCETLDAECPGAWARRFIPAEPNSKACRETTWGRLTECAAPSGVVILDADEVARLVK